MTIPIGCNILKKEQNMFLNTCHHMNQYLVLGNTFNFRHLLPFDSNKAMYEYKNMALTDLLQNSREVGNLHWWIIKQHIVGAESAFITSHSGNPNAYSLAVKRNKIEARSTAGLFKFLICYGHTSSWKKGW